MSNYGLQAPFDATAADKWCQPLLTPTVIITCFIRNKYTMFQFQKHTGLTMDKKFQMFNETKAT